MDRHQPTVPSCPVPLELVALLMRADEELLGATLDTLPEAQRALLALYCFSRYHMRRLGLAVGLRCSKRSLEAAGGAAGRQLFDQATYAAAFDVAPTQHEKRKVTLARFVA